LSKASERLFKRTAQTKITSNEMALENFVTLCINVRSNREMLHEVGIDEIYTYIGSIVDETFVCDIPYFKKCTTFTSVFHTIVEYAEINESRIVLILSNDPKLFTIYFITKL
jgi:hypothetical protein